MHFISRSCDAMDSNVGYGSRMEARNDILAVVQNLNCIASPGKVVTAITAFVSILIN